MVRGYFDDDDRFDDDEGEQYEDVVCVAATEEALLLEGEIDPDEDQVWVPRSCVHPDSEVYQEGHEGTLVLRTWFVHKRGW